jgi:hypothetical protein
MVPSTAVLVAVAGECLSLLQGVKCHAQHSRAYRYYANSCENTTQPHVLGGTAAEQSCALRGFTYSSTHPVMSILALAGDAMAGDLWYCRCMKQG